jgi:integrase
LTLDEERRLLEACGERTITYKRNGKEITAHDKGESRAHLHAIIIALLDTGCRKGEVLQLRWRFVCFASRTITIEALTTKTLLTRKVGMTQRLFDELIALWEKSDKDLNALVFGITNNVTKAFMSACEASGVPYGSPNNITLHSLRHTAATRLVKGKMPLHIVGRILGHTQPQTTYRYLSADAEATAQAVSILEELQHEPADTSATVAQASELVN